MHLTSLYAFIRFFLFFHGSYLFILLFVWLFGSVSRDFYLPKVHHGERAMNSLATVASRTEYDVLFNTIFMFYVEY